MAKAKSVKLPRCNLAQIFRLRGLLFEEVFYDSYDFTPRGETFEDLVTSVTRAIPRAVRTAVYDSLAHLAGTQMTLTILRETAWRLAANVASLQQGIAVRPWDGRTNCGWLPVEVQQFMPTERRFGKQGGMIRMQVLAGPPAALCLNFWWSKGFMAMLARRIGFSAPWRKFPYSDPLQLVRLRFWVLLHATMGRGVDQIAISPSMTKWNRNLMRLRSHESTETEAWNCPRGHTEVCWRCLVGQANCPLAVWPGDGMELPPTTPVNVDTLPI